ncbi:ComEC/Rec2 family competence protein [Clostridium sp. BJN0001]|uniref:ComEC/Rec2 family competence protein n=1 Tax=Clostridium sp. BJN0001 TaxID=2930219 RepID=UPI001FD199D6|nr:ComEC/Rec2 family competence protein [Clostridium sp. BJN0001]
MKKIKRRKIIFILTTIMSLFLLFSGCSAKSSLPLENSSNDLEQSDDNSKYEIGDKDLKDLLKIHYIDVGQADCILIQQGDESMIIDAGNNDDENTIKDYLKKVNVSKFKYVVGTHPHEDHIGSLDYIVNNYDVNKVYFPKVTTTTKTFKNFINACKNKNLSLTVPKVSDTFMLGDAKCTIMAPNSEKYEDLNNYSIVIKVEYKNTSFLFTGDAEDVSEKEMLNKNLNLKADVLKVGHHGSHSSTTKEFLNAVSPRFAVISVGKDNDYGHPNDEIIKRLENFGTTIYRTDECGSIVCISDGKNINFDKDAQSNVDTSQSSVKNDDSDNKTVYWTKNGKSYHYDKNCSGLSKSKNILSGKLGECPKTDPCNRCVK